MCAICNFKIEFSVGHPLAISVAVATRRAIEAGLVDEQAHLSGALSAARARMSAVEALKMLQTRIETTHDTAALASLPDFYVLLIENDTWGFFHATENGFDPDIVPEMPDEQSNVLVMSEAGLRAWLDGRFDCEHALRDTLFIADASLIPMLAACERALLQA
jgi:hypothetical protein